MAMTLRLSEDDADALRAQAEREGRSMQVVACDAVREYIARRATTQDIETALHVLTPRYSRLLERLSDA